MKLYGSIKKRTHTYGRWYFELPEYWCKDKDYVREHPYLNIVDSTWSGVDPDNFNFYELNIDWMNFRRVFDLRGKYWKEKVSTFVMWYGQGWSHKGGLWADIEPHSHITHFGNYNVLASKGYKWVVSKYGPDKSGQLREIWQFIGLLNGPDASYEMKQLDGKEFFNEYPRY